MTGKLPSFFKETIWAMLNLCLTVYIGIAFLTSKPYIRDVTMIRKTLDGYMSSYQSTENDETPF